MTDYVLEVDAWTGAGVERLRFATRTLTTGPADTPANTTYLGRLLDTGMFARSVLEGGGIVGRPSTGVGSFSLNNQDGRLDALINYGFDGRPFVLREISGASPLQGATVLRGVLAGIDTQDAWASLRLRMRDRTAVLQTLLLTARYAGTTTSAGLGIEGDASLADQIKPLVLGSVTNIAPKAVNLFDLVYQVSVAAVSRIVAYDGAVPLAAGPDFPTVPALLAWAQVPGQYATCLAAGLFRLGGAPAFTVTADVVEGAALSDRSAARVAARMLDRLGIPAAERDAASFDAVHTLNPAEVGIFIDAETNAQDLIGQVFGSIGAALVPTAEGVFQAVGIGAPAGEPVATFGLRSIQGGDLSLAAGPDSGGVPAWSVVLTYGRVWQTMAAADLNRSGISAERKALLETATRKATAQDAAVRTAHPLAAEVTIDTLLTRQADAQAEAARLLALLKVRRDRLTLTVPDTKGRRALGDVVSLALPRFGFDAGKLFRVVSRQDDFRKRTVQLGLWG